MPGMFLKMTNLLGAYESPFSILGHKVKDSGAGDYYSKISVPLGIPQLWQIILGTGIVLAVIVMLAALIRLLIVNYPKTVTQTKQKIAHGLAVIFVLITLAGLFDTFLSIAESAVGM